MSRKKKSIEDVPLIRAREILSGSPSVQSGLVAEYSALADSYGSLLRKLHKTLLISDSYQAQLLELNSSLSQQVEEETERRMAHERLLARNSKLAALGEMIDAIAHQWRQPLSTLNMIVQNLREVRRHAELDDSYLESATGSALSQIRYMSETIGTFRSFFRQEKEQETFSVSEKVAAAADLLRSNLYGNAIALELSPVQGDDTVKGFPNEFVQVIINLIANSIDAIQERERPEPCGPGQHLTPDRIDLTVTPGERGVVVAVCDTGNGIPPEFAQCLFDPEFSTKKNREGTGMGLYMSRLIIEQSMGGKISFTSVPGRTQFIVELPRNRT